MSNLDLERDSEAEEVARKLLNQARRAGCRVAINPRGDLSIDGPVDARLARLLEAFKSPIETILTAADHPE
ncbi:MAG: hypothetical protein ACYC0Y_19330 [Pirellulales bacterium]